MHHVQVHISILKGRFNSCHDGPLLKKRILILKSVFLRTHFLKIFFLITQLVFMWKLFYNHLLKFLFVFPAWPLNVSLLLLHIQKCLNEVVICLNWSLWFVCCLHYFPCLLWFLIYFALLHFCPWTFNLLSLASWFAFKHDCNNASIISKPSILRALSLHGRRAYCILECKIFLFMQQYALFCYSSFLFWFTRNLLQLFLFLLWMESNNVDHESFSHSLKG